ncbi:hypothetical protein ACT9SR_13020, partial [Enterococcus faecalis]|uniref:hypothetical protein n=1 Tax=Enterococcus faecalis TaxID=1351 RepID=UPI00403A786D
MEGGGGVVLLGTPHGFVNASLSSSPFRAVPLFADFNGDRVSDVAVLDSSGKILF